MERPPPSSRISWPSASGALACRPHPVFPKSRQRIAVFGIERGAVLEGRAEPARKIRRELRGAGRSRIGFAARSGGPSFVDEGETADAIGCFTVTRFFVQAFSQHASGSRHQSPHRERSHSRSAVRTLRGFPVRQATSWRELAPRHTHDACSFFGNQGTNELVERW
jgi:hypothetical protein